MHLTAAPAASVNNHSNGKRKRAHDGPRTQAQAQARARALARTSRKRGQQDTRGWHWVHPQATAHQPRERTMSGAAGSRGDETC